MKEKSVKNVLICTCRNNGTYCIFIAHLIKQSKRKRKMQISYLGGWTTTGRKTSILAWVGPFISKPGDWRLIYSNLFHHIWATTIKRAGFEAIDFPNFSLLISILYRSTIGQILCRMGQKSPKLALFELVRWVSEKGTFRFGTHSNFSRMHCDNSIDFYLPLPIFFHCCGDYKCNFKFKLISKFWLYSSLISIVTKCLFLNIDQHFWI